MRVDGQVSTEQESKSPARGPRSVAIIGAGAAGATAAETLRKEGFEGGVTIFEAEPKGPIDRPKLSKTYLAGDSPAESVPLRSPDFYREHGIDLRVGTVVAEIDAENRALTLGDGQTLEWDALLLAMGATPRALSVPGADLPHVFRLRSWRDAEAIISAARSSQCAAVVGAGFIGLEVAAALRARELDVTVVAPESTPMERILGPDLGSHICELHEKNGVRFRLGEKVAAIDTDQVTLGDGSSVGADLVVVGVGVYPDTKLAEAAGLDCDDGIRVDELLRTRAPGIWAAGDLARWPDPRTGEPTRVEHWVVAQQLGRNAARNILGADEPFCAVPFFWSRHYDTSVHYVGTPVEWDEADPVGDPRHGQGAVLLRKAGRTLAVASVGDSRTSLEAELALDAGGKRLAAWEQSLGAGAGP